MRIAFFTPEAVPFVKTGGLADVTGALSQAVSGLGHEVIVVLPAYKKLSDSLKKAVKVQEDVSLLKHGKVNFYFLHNERYFSREQLYGDSSGDYSDNLARFAFYSSRGLRLLEEIGFSADIAHCNDWQSSLVPVYLKTLFSKRAFFKHTRSVLTLHNIGYQGVFPQADFAGTGLSPEMFSSAALEFYGKINLLKGGIIFSDALTTVSPTYSREIQCGEFGCGLEGVLAQRKGRLYGILNGLDYSIWDPLSDKHIAFNYNEDSLGAKAGNKKELQRICGLPQDADIPLFAVVSRLAEQKGIDLIALSLNALSRQEAQTVILGTGDQAYQRMLESIALKYPSSVSLQLKFDEELAHRIYAGSDIFLMPSRYEPCGLSQMIALRYGSVPVVSRTGGLSDTVDNFSGFLLDTLSADELLFRAEEAVGAYRDKDGWQRRIKLGMSRRFSWDKSASEYVSVYEKARNNA